MHFSTPHVSMNLIVFFSSPFFKKVQWRPELLVKNLLSIKVLDYTKSQCLFFSPSIAFVSSLVMDWVGWMGTFLHMELREHQSPWQKRQILDAAALLQTVQRIALITCCMDWRVSWGRNSGVCTQCLGSRWLDSGDWFLSCCPGAAVCTELISLSQCKLNTIHLELDAALTTWIFSINVMRGG